LTKDKQLVVHHDPTLDRTANIKGSIDQFTFAELQILDSAYQYTPKGAGKGPYLDSDFPFRGKGYKLPLFSTFMDAFEDAYKNIEIKDNDPLAAQLVWQELQRRPKLLNNVIVASGHCEVLRSFREISGGVVATSACEKEGLAFFVTHKLGIGKFWFWLFPPTAVAYQAPVVSSGVWLNFKYFVDAAHSMNQKLMYWVINDGELASELLDLGADGIVSDRADLIYHAYHTRGIVPTSLQERLANVIVNSSSSFYIPESNPREVHTCLSLGCRILPVIMNYFAPIALFLIVSFYLLIRKRAPVKIPVEPEIHNRGANPKSKGKRKVD
jgi:glycerophosphoryl diester phosphodiesterase